MDTDLTFFDAGFGNRGCVGLKGKVSSDAAADALRQWLSPFRFLGGELQNTLEARGVERLVFFRVGEVGDFAGITDQLQAEFQRIGACCRGQLVNEGFNYEAAAGMLDGAPPGAGDAGMR